MGQFDNIVKKAPEGRTRLSIPREAFPEKTQGNLPAGNVTVAGVEGYNPKEASAGGEPATSLPVRANVAPRRQVKSTLNGRTVANPSDVEPRRKSFAPPAKLEERPTAPSAPEAPIGSVSKVEPEALAARKAEAEYKGKERRRIREKNSKVGQTIAKENLVGHGHPYTESGDLKPEYNDIENDPEATTTMRVHGKDVVEGTAPRKAKFRKPEVETKGTVIPLHNIFPKVDFGKTTPQLEAIKKKQLANQGPRTTTQVLDQNKLNAVTSGQRSNEQEVVAKSKLNERFDAEERRPIHSPEVISKAKELAGRSVAAGGHGLPRQAIEHPAFEDTHRDIVRKAYVMHHTGITQDTAGTDVEKLEKYTGKGPAAKGRVDQAYKLIQNK